MATKTPITPDNKYYFLDESGKPEFYAGGNRLLIGTKDYSPVLIIGMIETKDRHKLRRLVLEFKERLINDPQFDKLSSIKKPGWYFHASKNHPKVRDAFFKFIKDLSYTCYIVVGRKDLANFHSTHKGKTNYFYFDLVRLLIKNRFKHKWLHHIFLASRVTNTKESLSTAVHKAVISYFASTKSKSGMRAYNCDILKYDGCPELWISDYLLWAFHRYIIHKDKKYFSLLEHKYAHIHDPYDTKVGSQKNYAYISKTNNKKRFELKKMGSFV